MAVMADGWKDNQIGTGYVVGSDPAGFDATFSSFGFCFTFLFFPLPCPPPSCCLIFMGLFRPAVEL